MGIDIKLNQCKLLQKNIELRKFTLKVFSRITKTSHPKIKKWAKHNKE